MGQGGPIDLKKSEDEEALYRETQIAQTQDASEYMSTNIADTNEWDSKRQRPRRTTRRPTRFLDRDFETQFRPEERRKRCSKLGRGEPAPQKDDKLYHTYKHTRKKAGFDHGRGEISRKTVKRTSLSAADRLISLDQRLEVAQENCRPPDTTNRKQMNLTRIGWPTWQGTRFRQQRMTQRPHTRKKLSRCTPRFRTLNQQPLGFRMLNRRQLGFRIHMHKLNPRPFRFRKLNRQKYRFRPLRQQELGVNLVSTTWISKRNPTGIYSVNSAS